MNLDSLTSFVKFNLSNLLAIPDVTLFKPDHCSQSEQLTSHFAPQNKLLPNMKTNSIAIAKIASRMRW